MRSRLHVGSLSIGLLAGVGMTLLVGAASPATHPVGGPSIGRYEVRAVSGSNGSTGYVVDTATGEIFIVQEQNAGNVVRPQWGQ